MSAASQTRIFGVRIGIDPKILVGGLIILAGILWWENSRSDDDTSTPAATMNRPAAVPLSAAALRPHAAVRRATSVSDRDTLRLRPIDATRGDVDPTLRLDLLNRLQFVKADPGGRSLFEVGPPPLTAEQKALLANAPRLPPKPPPIQPAVNTPPVVNIPLKYYGFVKPGDRGATNRGLFLDGDNVLVASEGEVLKQRYLVVELTGTSARLEDVQMKQGQTLAVVPVAQQ